MFFILNVASHSVSPSFTFRVSIEYELMVHSDSKGLQVISAQLTEYSSLKRKMVVSYGKHTAARCDANLLYGICGTSNLNSNLVVIFQFSDFLENLPNL